MGKPLRPSARCRLTYEGRRAQLVITEATLQDSGRYKCEAAGALEQFHCQGPW